MSHCKKTSGFSLIELMVVLAIVSSLMMLTGGLVVESIAKQTRIVELKKVQNIFKVLSYKAYYGGYSFEIELIGDQIHVKSETEENTIKFKELRFKNSKIVISTKASISPHSFIILEKSHEREVQIAPLFETYNQG